MNTRFLIALLAAGLLSAASRPEMLVSSEWLSSHVNDPKLVIVHVSAARATYDAGHIPGARFLPQSDIAVTREGVHNELADVPVLQKAFESLGISNDTRVIVYSDSSVLPATRTYFTLDYLGHGDRTALLDGGLDQWRAEGRPVTKDVPAPAMAGHLTPKLKPEIVVQMAEVQKIKGSGQVLLDVRQASDFSTSHIPGATNLYWMGGQQSKENQALKSGEELMKFYSSAGIKPDSKVVTYCNSGMQASQSYFTLKYLGYDVRMYDGSMSEWNLKNGPTEK